MQTLPYRASTAWAVKASPGPPPAQLLASPAGGPTTIDGVEVAAPSRPAPIASPLEAPSGAPDAVSSAMWRPVHRELQRALTGEPGVVRGRRRIEARRWRLAALTDLMTQALRADRSDLLARPLPGPSNDVTLVGLAECAGLSICAFVAALKQAAVPDHRASAPHQEVLRRGLRRLHEGLIALSSFPPFQAAITIYVSSLNMSINLDAHAVSYSGLKYDVAAALANAKPFEPLFLLLDHLDSMVCELE